MHASLNRVYRLVWSDRTLSWVAVPETGCARGARGHTSRMARTVALGGGVLAGAMLSAVAGSSLPTGGQITQGQGSITQSGNALTIQQNSQRLVAQWGSFNIGAGQKVQFLQPSSSAVALNRVTGTEASKILGSLQANGQVYLINPNGVLFGTGARVDTGGLLASTLNLSDADFMAGRLRLTGESTAAVRNDGTITTHEGGSVAFIAAQVTNQGSIQADGGNVALASGQDVTLDMGTGVQLQIHVAPCKV